MTTPPAPSSLVADLLIRGVSFNPRFVRPVRLPHWPGLLGLPAEGVVLRFEDGATVIPPVRGKEDAGALRLRDVRGETLLKDGDATAGSVALIRMPPGFGEPAPSRVPFSSFLAPLPGVLAVDLRGAAFGGRDRCAFCGHPEQPSAPRLVDLAEGFARFGQDRALHLSVCCGYRYDERPVMAALETAAAVMPPVPVSVEIPPGGGRDALRALLGKGVVQLIADLDAPDAATFRVRCPGRGTAVGWDAIREQVDDALAVFGKGRVGVRMILYPGDGPSVLPLLRRLSTAGAVPLVIPFAPGGAAEQPPGQLLELARRVSAAGRGRSLAIDPYACYALPSRGAAAPAPWYRRLLSFLGLGGRDGR